jgi:hypothetical protein
MQAVATRKFSLVGIVVLSLATIITLAGLALARSGSLSMPQPAAPVVGPKLPLATPRFFESDGPYLGDALALQYAHAVAVGPVTRDEAHLMTYGDVVAWLGNQNLLYDRSREMYVVAVSGRYEPRGAGLSGSGPDPVCNSYFEVIDATDGTVLSLGCGGAGTWPANLPPVFSK